MKKLIRLLDIALLESIRCPECGRTIGASGKCQRCGYTPHMPTALSSTLTEIVNLASSFIANDKTLHDLLKFTQYTGLSEAAGSITDIEVELYEIFPTHSMYKIKIPTVKGPTIVAYAVKENIPLKGEKPEDMIIRIMDELKIIVQGNMQRYANIIKKKGNRSDAKQALMSQLFNLKDATKRFNELRNAKPKANITAPQLRTLQAVSNRVNKRYEELVKSKGLVSSRKVCMMLGLNSANAVVDFGERIIKKIAEQLPQWSELLDYKSLTPDEIGQAIPAAKVNEDIVKMVAKTNSVDISKLDKYGARALAAAAVIASAAIIAADRKIGVT